MVFLKDQNLLIYYCLNDTQTYINEYNNREYSGLERTDFYQFLYWEGVMVLIN